VKYPCTFFLILLFPYLLCAQSNDENLGKAKFSRTFDYVSLAHALTDSVTSDSLKVKSIYLWMTKHIDYDVSGFTSGAGSYTDPNEILRHRKSVCLGNSILFDSLCSVAGIQAECVWGYVYMPWYETHDTLYLDSHAWNSVYIDGEWQLIDVTWGAGYVKQKKQTARKVMYRLFRIPYRTKYRFIHKTNMKYYRTAPEIFVQDHLPSTPAWQLLECSVPIDSFQRTPHATLNHLAGGATCEHGNDSIEPIVTAQQQDHMYVQGKQALGTNAHNHQDISFGQLQRIMVVIRMAEDTGVSIDQQIIYFDSAIVMTDSLIRYFRLTSKDAELEGKFFDRRNRRMREQTTSETRPSIRKHKKAIDEIKAERFRISKQIIRLKRENKKLRRENKRIRKKKFSVRRPIVANDKVTIQRDTLVSKTERLNDSIANLRDSMQLSSYYNYSWEIVYYDTVVRQKKRRLKLEFYDMREVNFFRGLGYTCYDTCVFTPKNQYLLTQQEVDSLNRLLPRPGKWIMDSAASAYKGDAYLAKMMLRMTMSNYKQLARMPAGTVDERAGFDSAKVQIQDINDSLIHNNRQRIQDLRYYRGTLRKFRLMHYRVKFQLQREMRSEGWRYVTTREFFKRYFKGVSLAFRRNADIARGIKGECKKAKKGLQRKKAKLQREEEKRKKKEIKLKPQE
jgi:hypothetical protein